MEPAGVLRHHQFRACHGGGECAHQWPDFVAFLFAKLLDVKLGNRKTTAIIMLVVEVTAAIIGLIIMILMFRALYAA